MPRRRAIALGVAFPGLLLWACDGCLAPPVDGAREEIVPVPPPPPLEAWADEGFEVVSLQGRAERRRADGQWMQVSVGDELRADEAIRTWQDARAVLGIRKEGTVEIAQRSEFTVKEISRTVARIRLEQGRMSAELGGARPLRIEDRDGHVRAEASSGRFSAMSQGARHMVIASETARVDFSARAFSVKVNPGEQSETLDGAAPSAPHAIPKTLYLKIRSPPKALQREAHAKLHGETAPGAIVSVNGVSFAADETGVVEVDVPLREGRNVLVLRAEDPLGRSATVMLSPITVKREVAPVKTKVIWPGGGE